MTEVWKTIPGFSRYSVSSEGRVRRDVRLGTKLPGPLVLSMNTGYPRVSITDDDGNYCGVHVHAIVAAAFIGPRPDGLLVRHLNGNPTDNRPDNLAYGTHADNVQDAIAHGTQVRGARQHLARLTDGRIDGKRKHLGEFRLEADAAAAVAAWRQGRAIEGGR
jgi:hypothetical protein